MEHLLQDSQELSNELSDVKGNIKILKARELAKTEATASPETVVAPLQRTRSSWSSFGATRGNEPMDLQDVWNDSVGRPRRNDASSSAAAKAAQQNAAPRSVSLDIEAKDITLNEAYCRPYVRLSNFSIEFAGFIKDISAQVGTDTEYKGGWINALNTNFVKAFNIFTIRELRELFNDISEKDNLFNDQKEKEKAIQYIICIRFKRDLSGIWEKIKDAKDRVGFNCIREELNALRKDLTLDTRYACGDDIDELHHLMEVLRLDKDQIKAVLNGYKDIVDGYEAYNYSERAKAFDLFVAAQSKLDITLPGHLKALLDEPSKNIEREKEALRTPLLADSVKKAELAWANAESNPSAEAWREADKLYSHAINYSERTQTLQLLAIVSICRAHNAELIPQNTELILNVLIYSNQLCSKQLESAEGADREFLETQIRDYLVPNIGEYTRKSNREKAALAAISRASGAGLDAACIPVAEAAAAQEEEAKLAAAPEAEAVKAAEAAAAGAPPVVVAEDGAAAAKDAAAEPVAPPPVAEEAAEQQRIAAAAVVVVAPPPPLPPPADAVAAAAAEEAVPAAEVVKEAATADTVPAAVVVALTPVPEVPTAAEGALAKYTAGEAEQILKARVAEISKEIDQQAAILVQNKEELAGLQSTKSKKSNH